MNALCMMGNGVRNKFRQRDRQGCILEERTSANVVCTDGACPHKRGHPGSGESCLRASCFK